MTSKALDSKVKDFVYLVQGAKNRVADFQHLQNRSSDLYTLTYDLDFDAADKPGVENLYVPKSTWAEGRNALLSLVKSADYKYFIFLDDDVELTKGTFEDFQNLLLRHKPSIGLPLLDEVKASNRYDRRLHMQRPVCLDQLVQAYSRETVEQEICLPFVNDFDDLSWWLGCEINQFLVLRYYGQTSIQFNLIEATNTNHSWNDSSEASAGSNYVGGITEEGKNLVREYIVRRFGSQPRIVNSLFHDHRFPRLIYSKPAGETFREAVDQSKQKNFRRAGGLVRALFRGYSTHLINRVFNPKSLINEEVRI